MKAVILAAGKGTRMRHLTADQPKPMVEVGKRRILEHILFTIRDSGIREFVVVTGYFANLIEDHFGDGGKFDMRITYVRQEKIDGTGNALHLTRDIVGNESFFMSFGDIITSIENYPHIIETYRRHPCTALLTLAEVDDPHQGAAVYVDESGRVTKIVEKPAKGTSTTSWNNAGIFVFDPIVFQYTAALTPSPRGEYELTQAIHRMLEEGREVRGFPLTGYWGDMGTPEDVEHMTKLLEASEESARA
ncbi:MAG: nucleotidyltransferase family protein [bacterium]